MTEYEERRIVMVESQLRPNEITDRALLTVMRKLPREIFLPEPLRGLAYRDEDMEVLSASEKSAAPFLLSPMVQAWLIQLAAITAQDSVLDLGCATGYSTAILARLAARVVGVEPEPGLAETARTNLSTLSLKNTDIVARGFMEPPQGAGAFDAIVIEGCVLAVPDVVFRQLKEGGRLVAVLTDGPGRRQGKATIFCASTVRREAFRSLMQALPHCRALRQNRSSLFSGVSPLLRGSHSP